MTCEDCEKIFYNKGNLMFMTVGNTHIMAIACSKHLEEAYQTTIRWRRFIDLSKELLK